MEKSFWYFWALVIAYPLCGIGSRARPPYLMSNECAAGTCAAMTSMERVLFGGINVAKPNGEAERGCDNNDNYWFLCLDKLLSIVNKYPLKNTIIIIHRYAFSIEACYGAFGNDAFAINWKWWWSNNCCRYGLGDSSLETNSFRTNWFQRVNWKIRWCCRISPNSLSCGAIPDLRSALGVRKIGYWGWNSGAAMKFSWKQTLGIEKNHHTLPITIAIHRWALFRTNFFLVFHRFRCEKNQ